MDGGGVDRPQVDVVGLVAGVFDLAVLMRGQGVEDADLEVGVGEGTFDGQVIAARAFDDDDDIVELVLTTRLTNGLDGKGVVQVLDSRGLWAECGRVS